MLTPRENLLETIRGGKPEGYVNQFEPFALQWATPQDIRYPDPEYGKGSVKNCWGVTMEWPVGTPGAFPVHRPELIVVKDIETWEEYLKIPDTNFSEAEWEPLIKEAESVNRKEYLVTSCLWPGIFENCHHFMTMEECMINLYEEPERMHDLIKYIKDYEIKLAEQIVDHIHPDAIYRHDDWGSQKSTFMSREMFQEFYLEPTKEIYQYYKNHGVEVIVHHSDSYCETFVPDMIDAGIDIWQGAMSTNNFPAIIEKYGDKLTLMGGIDNGKIDREDWTVEKIEKEVRDICNWAGKKFFIPNCTFGGDASTYEGVYDCVTKIINQINEE